MLRDAFLAEVLGIPSTTLDHVMSERARADLLVAEAERLVADLAHLVGVAHDHAVEAERRAERYASAGYVGTPISQARALLAQAEDAAAALAALLADEFHTVTRARSHAA